MQQDTKRDPSASDAGVRKPYKPPTVETLPLFERMAVACASPGKFSSGSQS